MPVIAAKIHVAQTPETIGPSQIQLGPFLYVSGENKTMLEKAQAEIKEREAKALEDAENQINMAKQAAANTVKQAELIADNIIKSANEGTYDPNKNYGLFETPEIKPIKVTPLDIVYEEEEIISLPIETPIEDIAPIEQKEFVAPTVIELPELISPSKLPKYTYRLKVIGVLGNSLPDSLKNITLDEAKERSNEFTVTPRRRDIKITHNETGTYKLVKDIKYLPWTNLHYDYSILDNALPDEYKGVSFEQAKNYPDIFVTMVVPFVRNMPGTIYKIRLNEDNYPLAKTRSKKYKIAKRVVDGIEYRFDIPVENNFLPDRFKYINLEEAKAKPEIFKVTSLEGQSKIIHIPTNTYKLL